MYDGRRHLQNVEPTLISASPLLRGPVPSSEHPSASLGISNASNFAPDFISVQHLKVGLLVAICTEFAGLWRDYHVG